MSTFVTVLLALGPFAMMLAGLAVWCILAYVQSRSRTARSGPLAAGLAALGWVLLLVGLFAAVGIMTQYLFVLAWLITIILIISALRHYRQLERRSLLWTLMVAAEHNIPLEAAARSFATEHPGRLGTRTLDLADYLEAGLPLALALDRSRQRMPADMRLATDLGPRTGDLGAMLRQALRRADDFELLLRSTTEKLLYLAGLVLLALVAWGFSLIKIVPAFQKILADFGVATPGITQALIGISQWTAEYWFLPLPLLLLLPLVRRLWQRADAAVILRWLAVAVRRQRPIAEMVRLLAGYFPTHRLRQKLERAAKRIEQGQDWCDSLRQVGLIRRPESAVFQAARRAGNLAWALDEMADSSVRRSAYRFQAFLDIAFPVVLVAFGGFVFLLAIGLLAPLFVLFQRLAS